MDMTLRWFGEGVDSVSLEQIRQIPGVKGVITTLYDIPAGEAWPMERFQQMKAYVEERGLKVLGIESVNIHDAIKVGIPEREKYIAKSSLIRAIRSGSHPGSSKPLDFSPMDANIFSGLILSISFWS